jgi:protein O-mannosyl-transferase
VHLDFRQKGVSAGLVAMLGVTLWVLWPGINGPFLFDDFPNFENLNQLGCRFDRLSVGTYLAVFTGTPGRPLAALSFLLNDCSWPSDAMRGFKLTNLLLHLLTGIMVFGLGRALAHARGFARADWIALLAAAIWLLSPINVSAVFLTVQRMTILGGLFLFGAMWAYVCLLSKSTTVPRAIVSSTVLATGTLLAFLCKENGALAPLLALVLHATLLRPTLAALPPWPRRLLWMAPTIAVVLLAAVLTVQWPHIADFSSRPFTQAERLWTEGRILVTYLALIVIPQLSSSSLYNDNYPLSYGWLDPASTLLSWAAIVILLCVAFMLRRKQPVFAFMILWFFAGHILESTALSLELYFEHRNYVPLFGIAFAVSVAVLRLTGKLRRPALIGIGLWLLLAAGLSNLQSQVWGNWALLSTVWYAENAGSQRAQQQYADFLMRTGQAGLAREAVAQSAEGSTAPLDARLQLLLLDCSSGAPITPERIQSIREGLRRQHVTFGTSAILENLRSSVEADQCPQAIGRKQWLEFTRLALANPNGGGLQRHLHMERAYLFVNLGTLDPAIRELEKAWSLGREPRIAFYAAAILASAERFDEAREWAQRPLSHPGNRFKSWLSGNDTQARQLLHAIDRAERVQRKEL